MVVAAHTAAAASALLDGSVDYAGLFPPAALSMRDAVARYATYRTGAHRAMLGRFVLPVARLDEFTNEWDRIAGPGGPPWRLSVLAGAGDAATLDAYNAAHAGRIVIDTVEAKADDEKGVVALAAALGARFTVFVEVGVRSDPAPLIAAVARHGLRAKIRTGGVTPDAFPSTAEVLRFLAACVAAKVPFKATAGLHHPIRGEFALTYAADAPRGTMHGFLNVFVAALFLREGVRPDAVTPLLEERDPSAIAFTAAGVEWRGRRVGIAAIRAARAEFLGSFGSCSFEEPVDDLTRLHLA